MVKLDEKKASKKTAQMAADRRKRSKAVQEDADLRNENVMSWKQALAFAKELDVILIPYELAKGMKETREIIASDLVPGQSCGHFYRPGGRL